MLRSFLYLDAALIAEFLGQLEGGLSLSEEIRTTGLSERSAQGGVRAGPLGASASIGGESRRESERTVEQTAASLFDRLYGQLDQVGQVQPLSALDDNIWRQLRRGEVVDVEASIYLAGLTKLFDLAAKVQQLSQVASLFDRPLDSESMASLGQITDLASLMKSDWVPVVAHVVGNPKYKFLARLNRESLAVDPMELEGEAIVFGKIQRILQPREELPVADVLPGWSALPREKRKELETSLKRTDISKFGLGELSIRAPGAVLMPVAVYR